jgi:LmbE family N-acetylglucosaminyl deacetylase
MIRTSCVHNHLFVMLFTCAATALTAAPATAQSAAQPAAAQPETAPLVVMNLAAHPDDEDGSTLAYYRRGRDAIAYSVIYTRGEGGQNEIGPELYEELGAIRTRETLGAARRLGTQVFFLNFKDFGFSKTAAETFERWGGRDEVTARVVYMIRKLKPDVLFTNHDTLTVGPDRQHGHHQAVGLTAYEAFDLAADPSYHPEQLDEPGVDLWQPKRLFHRLWSPEDGPYDLAVPVGRHDEELGTSYAGMAAEGLHAHASQGMEMFADLVAGWEATYFEQYRSAVDAPLTDDDLAANLPPNQTAEPDLDYWIDSGRIPQLPPDAVTVDDTLTVPGQRVHLNWRLEAFPTRPVRLRLFGALDTTVVLRDDSLPSDDFVIRRTHPPTIPQHLFQYARFESRPPLGYVVYDARSSRMLAGGYVSMEIAPALLVETEAEVMRFEQGENAVPYTIRVFDPSVDTLTIAAALSEDAERRVLDQRQSSLTVASNRIEGRARLRLPAESEPGAYTVSLTAHAAGGTNGPVTEDKFVRARTFEVDVPADLRVGVVASYDRTLDDALTELGVEHVLLDSTDLAAGDFEGLHTIVVDIRAYLVRPDLRLYNEQLLEWVREGGHLVVNYQKTFEWNAEHADPFDAGRNNPGNFAPYPLDLGRDRVTRESAPVTVLHPDHPVVTMPNEIDAADWEGWVQERGLYFPQTYDERYTELFSLHDPDEPALAGSTLLADVGSGTYLYTALVWYRQLKEYHPGAYKMFANMISLPFADGRTAGL